AGARCSARPPAGAGAFLPANRPGSCARSRPPAARAAQARYVLGRSVMMNRTVPSIAFAFVLLAACDHQDSSGTPAARTPSGTQLAAPVDPHAIDAIAGARCDREQTCNNVGVD